MKNNLFKDMTYDQLINSLKENIESSRESKISAVFAAARKY